jgi:hypothetical protein
MMERQSIKTFKLQTSSQNRQGHLIQHSSEQLRGKRELFSSPIEIQQDLPRLPTRQFNAK